MEVKNKITIKHSQILTISRVFKVQTPSASLSLSVDFSFKDPILIGGDIFTSFIVTM